VERPLTRSNIQKIASAEGTIMTKRASLLIIPFAFATACASTTTTSGDKAETSSAAIRAAEEVGATHTPDAALHLQLAKEQFEHASKLNKPSDRAVVDRLLARAQADAELALALARSDSEKAEARGAIDKVNKLKSSAIQ
jgi:hypothetical protein